MVLNWKNINRNVYGVLLLCILAPKVFAAEPEYRCNTGSAMNQWRCFEKELEITGNTINEVLTQIKSKIMQNNQTEELIYRLDSSQEAWLAYAKPNGDIENRKTVIQVTLKTVGRDGYSFNFSEYGDYPHGF
jgi:uncharacterized protein YecT (DUF1311 family)